MSHVFISHEKSDDGLAHEIRSYLEAGGFECWMAPDDIRGPLPWPEQISNAIDSCDVMLVVVSAHANGSPHVSREVDLAVEKGKPLLPVRVEDIAPTGSLDYLLRLAQWIDLFPGSVADHAASLQSMVGAMQAERGLARPEPPPEPPAPKPEPQRRRPQIPRWAALAIGVVAVLTVATIGIGVALRSGDEGVPSADSDTERPDDTPVDEADDGVPSADEGGEPGDGETAAPVKDDAEAITRVSVASDGTAGNDHSVNPSISADGRYVAFDSLASNLVENDMGGWRDVFVHDRETGDTIRVNEVRNLGGFAEEAFGSSRGPRISADGNWVVFVSDAPNLVPFGDDLNDASDIFLWDRTTGETTLVSRNADGRPLHTLNSIDPSMSDGGTVIAYATYQDQARPAVGTNPGAGPYTAWVYDVATQTTTQLAVFSGEEGGAKLAPPVVARSGNIAIAGQASGGGVFLYDARDATVVSLPDLASAIHDTPFFSLVPLPDGTGIYFTSASDQLVADDLNGTPDVFFYNLEDSSASGGTRVGGSLRMVYEPSVGQDRAGFIVGVLGQEHLLVRFDPPAVLDLNWTASTTVALPGGALSEFAEEAGVVQGGDYPGRGRPWFEVSRDARFAAFASADDLVDGDTNSKKDIFVIELPAPKPPPPRVEIGRIDGTQFGGWVPVGVAIDASGRVLVADEAGSVVRVFDSEGSYLSSFSANAPHGIAVGPGGEIYTTSFSNHIVEKFDSDGNRLFSWGGAGFDPGQFDNPIHVAVDSRGFVYVTDAGRVQVFDSDGLWQNSWRTTEEGTSLRSVSGIAIGEFESAPCSICDAGTVVFYGDFDRQEVRRQLPDGSPAGPPWPSVTPNGLDVDEGGVVFVAGPGVVGRYDPNGLFFEFWRSEAFSDEGPVDVAVSESGDVWVTDQFSGYLIHFG